MPDSRQKAAIVLKCSDPRLEGAVASINTQLKQGLRVDSIIPLTSPGIVGLFSRKVGNDEFSLPREALERSIKIHLGMHWPSAVVIAAHHDCLGCPGSDKQQEGYALAAAGELQKFLRRRFDFVGDVRAVMIELHPNPGWKVKFLG